LIEPKRKVKFAALGKLRALERCLPDIKNSWTSVESSTQGEIADFDFLLLRLL
jgi:hypothetical protein